MPVLLLRRSTTNTRPSIGITSSFSSPSPSPSPSPPLGLHTIYNKRILSRASASSPPPPSLQGLGLPPSLFPNTHRPAKRQRQASDSETEIQVQESDVECWMRMLALQREFHCYNSARLEAAVEALEMGWSIEEVPIPSRLCLNLLNEGLRAQMLERRAMKGQQSERRRNDGEVAL